MWVPRADQEALLISNFCMHRLHSQPVQFINEKKKLTILMGFLKILPV